MPSTNAASTAVMYVLTLTPKNMYSSKYKVSGEAQGDESKIKVRHGIHNVLHLHSQSRQQFVEHLNKGPSAASVDKVEQHRIDVKEGESGFSR